MASAILGQVVGAAEGSIDLVDGQEKKVGLVPTPEQLVVSATTREAQQKLVATIDHLAGDGKLGAALVAHLPSEFADLADDEEDLLNWLRLYRAVKADLADNGQIDQVGEHLADIAQLLHLQEAAAGWAGNLFGKLKSMIGGKK